MTNDIREVLCAAPDTQLDAAMRPLIKGWSEPASALQVLEVLDKCINGSLASSFIIKTLQVLYEAACKRENVAHADVVKNAVWRTA